MKGLRQTNNIKRLKMGMGKCDLCGYLTTDFLYFIDVYSSGNKNKKLCPRKYVCSGCYIRLKKYKGQKRMIMKKE